MPTELFVDTSAWYPLADPEHPDHAACAEAIREEVKRGTRIVTTNLVVAESYALLLNRLGRESALAFLGEVSRPPLRSRAPHPISNCAPAPIGSRPTTITISPWPTR